MLIAIYVAAAAVVRIAGDIGLAAILNLGVAIIPARGAGDYCAITRRAAVNINVGKVADNPAAAAIVGI